MAGNCNIKDSVVARKGEANDLLMSASDDQRCGPNLEDILNKVVNKMNKMVTKDDLCGIKDSIIRISDGTIKMEGFIEKLISGHASLLQRIVELEAEISFLNDKIKVYDSTDVNISDSDYMENQGVKNYNPADDGLLGKTKDKLKVCSSKGGGRGNRIIIEGLPFDCEPFEILNELASVLEIPNMSNIRIKYVKKWTSGAGTDEPREMLRICFVNRCDRDKFICKDINIKLRDIGSSARFHGVKIYPDRPFAEREAFKLLLNEAKMRNKTLSNGEAMPYRWVVGHGKLYKIRIRSCGRPVI